MADYEHLIAVCSTETYRDCLYYEGRITLSWYQSAPTVHFQVSTYSETENHVSNVINLADYDKTILLNRFSETNGLVEELTEIVETGFTLAESPVFVYKSVEHGG